MTYTQRFSLLLPALGVAALCATAPAAGAQAAQGGGCTNCRGPELTEADQRRIAQVRRDLERVVERARLRIDELREHSEYRTSEAPQMRRAKIALERAEPATHEFAMQMAELQALAAREVPRFFEDPEFKGALKEMHRLHGELRMREVRGPRRGYLGVSFSSGGSVGPGGRIMFAVDAYPEVISVDTDSPAAAAGVRSGDVLLALNGRDVVRQGPIVLSDLLVPGETVRVRVRRGRETKDLPVRVGLAQEKFAIVYGTAGAAPGAWSTSTSTRPPATPTAPRPPGVRPVPVRPGEAPAATTWVFNNDGVSLMRSSLLGAELQSMDRDQRDALSVDDGVVIIKVQQGSLAARANLRSFDVVQRIDGELVQSPDDLRAAIDRARQNGADSVVVTVVTRRKERKVTLRW